MQTKKKVFDILTFGDLILAKRLNTQKVEKDHQNEVLLVIGRSHERLICLYGTSKENPKSIIKIPKNNYNLSKDIYITSRIILISINEFIKSLHYSNEFEKKNFIKSLFINGFSSYSFLKEPPIEIGDIVQLKHKHLIIGETDDKYMTVKITQNEINKSYTFNYNNKNLLEKGLKYKRVGFLSREELIDCLKEAKNIYTSSKDEKSQPILSKETINPLQVGNLVVYEKMLYYLYYQLNNTSLSFKVSTKQKIGLEQIIINGNIYYADFKQKKDFNNDQEKILLVSQATEEEKKLIKTKKNNHFLR